MRQRRVEPAIESGKDFPATFRRPDVLRRSWCFASSRVRPQMARGQGAANLWGGRRLWSKQLSPNLGGVPKREALWSNESIDKQKHRAMTSRVKGDMRPCVRFQKQICNLSEGPAGPDHFWSKASLPSQPKCSCISKQNMILYAP